MFVGTCFHQLFDLVVAGTECAVHSEAFYVVQERPSNAKHHVLENIKNGESMESCMQRNKSVYFVWGMEDLTAKISLAMHTCVIWKALCTYVAGRPGT